jgi:hypothetical protein
MDADRGDRQPPRGNDNPSAHDKTSSLPQPPHAPNRLAQNMLPGRLPGVPIDSGNETVNQWRSRAPAKTDDSQLTAEGTTQLWQPTAQALVSTAAGISRTGESPQPADAPSAPPPVAMTAQLPTSATWPSRPVATPSDFSPGGPPQTPGTPLQQNAVWTSSTTGQPDALPPPQPSTLMDSGPKFEQLRGMARHANSRQFQLEYEIDAVGPEGVRDVELWVSQDGADSWRKLTHDEDRRSPVDVTVAGEGIFGFRIRVVSNEGLGSRPPRSGDPADVWVNVDTTIPHAAIIAAPYGNAADAGRLMIQWRATDNNLSLRPVRLLYSPHPQGPWTTIEDGIRNDGEYAWKPAVDTPDQVYLRLEVRDEAGNVGVHQPDRPIDISGLIPRGHIRGITPILPPKPGGGRGQEGKLST